MAAVILKVMGWRTVGQPPALAKYVFVAAPHTSNWDFFFMYVGAKRLRVRLAWMGKESLFEGPFGWYMRALNGVPVKRGSGHNMVDQMVQEFQKRDSLILAVPPSGTRRKMSHWRSGFYHIALGARVPLALGFVDYGRKEIGIGPVFMPSGNVTTDMDIIRAFYSTITPKYPEKMSEVYLAQELEPDETAETDASAEMDTGTEAEVEAEREAVA
jgi:1-acyl-sn-glycerol-3-phosphate acyltransferase